MFDSRHISRRMEWSCAPEEQISRRIADGWSGTSMERCGIVLSIDNAIETKSFTVQIYFATIWFFLCATWKFRKFIVSKYGCKGFGYSLLLYTVFCVSFFFSAWKVLNVLHHTFYLLKLSRPLTQQQCKWHHPREEENWKTRFYEFYELGPPLNEFLNGPLFYLWCSTLTVVYFSMGLFVSGTTKMTTFIITS